MTDNIKAGFELLLKGVVVLCGIWIAQVQSDISTLEKDHKRDHDKIIVLEERQMQLRKDLDHLKNSKRYGER